MVCLRVFSCAPLAIIKDAQICLKKGSLLNCKVWGCLQGPNGHWCWIRMMPICLHAYPSSHSSKNPPCNHTERKCGCPLFTRKGACFLLQFHNINEAYHRTCSASNCHQPNVVVLTSCNHHPPLGIGLGMVAHVKDEEWKPWKKEVKSLVLVALAVVGSDFVKRCWSCLMELLMGGK